MLKKMAAFVFFLCGACAFAEDTTPLDTKIPESQEFMVACKVPDGIEPLKKDEPPGGIYHYRLWLPQGYHDTETLRYPCMFIASPSGDAKMGNMAERLKRDRWIVIMLVESKNHSYAWLNSFISAHDDALKRVRILDNAKFTTGMPGGARCVSAHPPAREGFMAVILQAAGFFAEVESVKYAAKNKEIMYFGTFGNTDMNLYESLEVRLGLPADTHRAIEVFEGGHAWAPTDVFDRALDWLERKIFVEVDYDKNLKEACLWYLSNQEALLNSAQTDFGKYEQAELLLELAKKYKLNKDETFAEKLAAWNGLADQFKDTVKEELNARKAFLKLREEEEGYFCGGGSKKFKQWAKLVKPEKKKSAPPHPLVAMAEKYAKMAKKYPDSAYAKKAEQRASALTLEATAKPKYSSTPAFERR
jgi:hypothetical protein